MRHCETSRVWHCCRISSVRAVRVLGAESSVSAAPAAFTVQRGDLWLTDVRQNTLAACRGSKRNTVAESLTLSVVLKQTVL